MYQSITYPYDYTPFLQELKVGLCVAIYEAITYPLDLLSSRSINRQYNYTKSILNYKESVIIFKEDCQRISVLLWPQIQTRHVDQYAFTQYGEPNNNIFEITPDHQLQQPLLTYIKLSDPKVLSILGLANFIGLTLSQPISVIRVRLQNENIETQKTKAYNQKIREFISKHGSTFSFFRAGFTSRFIYNYIQFVCELGFMQYGLQKLGCQFMNVESKEQQNRPIKYSQLAFAIIGLSTLTSLITHPFYLYNQKYVFSYLTDRKISSIQLIKNILNSGFDGFQKGLLSNMIRGSIRNSIIFGVLWNDAKSEQLERLRPKSR